MAPLFAQSVRSRWLSAACLVVVLLAVVLPPNGFGIPMCQFRVMTHLPCLACGLTRSFIGMAHLDLGRAAFFHPLGLVLFPMTVAFAALLPASPGLRERLARWMEHHPLLLNLFSWMLLAVFILYGSGRIFWLLATGRPSPW